MISKTQWTAVGYLTLLGFGGAAFQLGTVTCSARPAPTSAVRAAARRAALAAALFEAVGKRDLAAVKSLLKQGADANARDDVNQTPLMVVTDCNEKYDFSVPIAQALLAKGANINAKANAGMTALTNAVYLQSPVAVKFLLDHGADVNAREEYGQTALDRAVDLGRLDIVELVLNAGAKLKPSRENGSVLAAAAGYGHLGIAKLLVARGARVNEGDGDGSTPLMVAAQGGHAAMVKFLLEKGALVNAKTTQGETALSQAATYGAVDVARALLEAGSDANARDKEGSTPLVSATIAAMFDEDAPLVKLLLDHGANPNLFGAGQSSLVFAAQGGSVKAVQLLLAHGANAAGSEGGSALLAVLKEGNKQRAQMALYAFGGTMTAEKAAALTARAEAADTTIVQALLDYGVGVTTGSNRVALIDAAAGGILPVVRLLLAKGAPVDISDADVPSPAMEAAVRLAKQNPAEAAEIMKAAREMGAAPAGLTPLMAAARNGHPDVALCLLGAGANVNEKDGAGRTPLMHVARAGRSAIARNLPVNREGILHRANEGAEKPVSKEVKPAEAAAWRKWANQGDSAIIGDLLAKHADLEARDGQGRTALMEAAVQSGPYLVQVLLRAGARVDATDTSGRTALMLVVGNGRIAHAPQLFSQELATAVLMANRHSSANAGAAQKAEANTIKAVADHQKAMVLGAATAEDVAVIRALLAAGAKAGAVDKKGRTALRIAEETRNSAIIALLRKATISAVGIARRH